MISRNAVLACLLMVGSFAVQAQPAPAPAGAPAAPPAPNSTNAIGPKIQFATPIHDFGKVKSGQPVHYSYVFTNTGDQLLQIRSVQPSCGCTTAGEWTRNVEPGKTGAIPVQFNSANFNGPVFKTITVASNAKDQGNTVLQLKGTVWKPIEFAPPYTIMTIMPDTPAASANVRVINNTPEPLQVWDPTSNNPDFTAQIKTNMPGKEFLVTIAAKPGLHSGNIAAKINLKTSSADSPTLDLPFWANVQPALMIMPNQVMLPQAPLAVRTTPTVTIQNNSTNHLTLSDPAINAPGVEVQIKEIQPGRVFSVQLEFPQGYENPAGKPVELTIKSSNAHTPLIKVPVLQMPKRTAAAFPNPGQPATPPLPKPAAQASR